MSNRREMAPVRSRKHTSSLCRSRVQPVGTATENPVGSVRRSKPAGTAPGPVLGDSAELGRLLGEAGLLVAGDDVGRVFDGCVLEGAVVLCDASVLRGALLTPLLCGEVAGCD